MPKIQPPPLGPLFPTRLLSCPRSNDSAGVTNTEQPHLEPEMGLGELLSLPASLPWAQNTRELAVCCLCCLVALITLNVVIMKGFFEWHFQTFTLIQMVHFNISKKPAIQGYLLQPLKGTSFISTAGTSMCGTKAGLLALTLEQRSMAGRFWMRLPRREVQVQDGMTAQRQGGPMGKGCVRPSPSASLVQ